LSRQQRRRAQRQARKESRPSWQRAPVRKRPSVARQQRPRGFHVPAWVVVGLVVGVVMALLAGLIVFREAGGVSPRIGDHWHASYEVWICGEKQPIMPAFPGGVHTHGDGIIHIHPETPAEEGRGARLIKFFEYAGRALGRGGVFTPDTFQMPGSDQIYRNGDVCPQGPFQGQAGMLQVFVNNRRLSAAELLEYIPHDGERVMIFFGPEGSAPEATPLTSPSPTGVASPSQE